MQSAVRREAERGIEPALPGFRLFRQSGGRRDCDNPARHEFSRRCRSTRPEGRVRQLERRSGRCDHFAGLSPAAFEVMKQQPKPDLGNR